MSEANSILLTQMIASNDEHDALNKAIDELKKNPYNAQGKHIFHDRNLLNDWIAEKKTKLMDKYRIKDPNEKDGYAKDIDGSAMYHDFALSGALEKFDNLRLQLETYGKNERSAFHKAQAVTFYEQNTDTNIRSTIATPDTNGNYNFKSLWDKIKKEEYEGMTPLTKEKRKITILQQTLVTASTLTSVGKNGQVDGLSLLDSIPKEYREGYEHLIEKAKVDMNQKAYTQMKQKLQMDEYWRTEGARLASITMGEIWAGTYKSGSHKFKNGQGFVLLKGDDNEEIDITASNDPQGTKRIALLNDFISKQPPENRFKLKEEALSLVDSDHEIISSQGSTNRVSALSQQILVISTADRGGANIAKMLFKGDDIEKYQTGNTYTRTLMLNELIDADRSIKRADKTAMKKTIPALLEGSKIIDEADLEKKFDVGLGASIAAYLQSVKGTIDQIKGSNLYVNSQRIYETAITDKIYKQIQEKGTVPNAREIDKFAQDALLFALQQQGIANKDGIINSNELAAVLENFVKVPDKAKSKAIKLD